MKNILVPCDFSRPAEEAFKFAVEIAGRAEGQIHVLHVIDITFLRGNPTLSHTYAFDVNFLSDMEKESDHKFQVMWGRYAPMTMKIKFKHVISSLIAEIETYVHENNIDLVVMGTHGKGNAAFGSNTEKVVRSIKVPVLALPTAPAKVKDIVFPVLPKDVDSNLIDHVKKLQNFFQARLHLLYINTPLFFKSDPESNDELQTFIRVNQFSDCTINVRSDYSIEEGITRFASDANADMIAMGTHAWKGLAHFFIGSTAADIVNHVRLPIWTLRLQ